jgi:hypothetical protein
MFAFATLLLFFLLVRLYPESPLSWERTLLACPICLAVYRFTFAGVRCGHNVIHQNSPFSSLRAASLSVAALNMDDSTFSMSSNVIILVVNLGPCPPITPPKPIQCGACGVFAVTVHRPSSFVSPTFRDEPSRA